MVPVRLVASSLNLSSSPSCAAAGATVAKTHTPIKSHHNLFISSSCAGCSIRYVIDVGTASIIHS